MHVKPRMAGRVLQHTREKEHISFENSFRKLGPYLQEYERVSAGAYTDFDVDQGGNFARVFLMPPYARVAQDDYQRILGVDGAHLRHLEIKGTMLILVTQDGNLKNVVLAVTVCSSESLLD